jgi:hypothetical protein
MSIEQGITENLENREKTETKQVFKNLIQSNQYVGDLYSINYENANVIINDFYRKRVGGIPSLSFLIATRVNPDDNNIDYKSEDASVILLRVMDSAPLPQDQEAERIRVETAQRVSGETIRNWDEPGSMDPKTKNLLNFAGVQCRIIGTFFLEADKNNNEGPLVLKFGCDISNYYPNRGLKVYKPNGIALETIVNYLDPSNVKANLEKYGDTAKIRLGVVRYASTNRKYQHIDDVPVYIYPADLLSQKTALFGMTRTGKSNTTKIIAKSVFELRKNKDASGKPLRIGQVVFDPNGEYANENAQDNNTALKNVWNLIPGAKKENEVVTYGITKHPNDPDRKMMLINFYLKENLDIGKEIINNILSEDSGKYIDNFCQVNFEEPDKSDFSAQTRYKRRVLAYRSILSRAGFAEPKSVMPNTNKLFGPAIIEALENSQSDSAADYKLAAKVFRTENPSWTQLANAFEALEKFTRDSEYKDFENKYVEKSSTAERWADEDFKKLIGIFQYPNGIRRIGKAVSQHSADTTSDYADDIYKDLVDGKLVIVDQSIGEPDLNKSSAKRVVEKIFRRNQQEFIKGNTVIPEILIYIEEAHNILPAGSDLDTSDIWVRTAKEGAKYHIGMVYATQEVSSIQKNILKNTANWFISHLNNTDETKELCKYYDFVDFEPSIRRAQDKGFLRVKTLSNLFVIPVQVDKFEI